MNKELIIFMPSIEGGGVEKNLFIISNFLVKKIKNKISLITLSKKFKNKFDKKINLITLKNPVWDNIGRRKKFFVSLYLLVLEIIKKKRKVTVFCFQGNIYCTLICMLFKVKIIVRSNSAPDGWSQSIIKHFFFKNIFKYADKIIVNSHDFKKKFKDRFDLDTTCIYNPLDVKEIIKKSKTKSPYNFPNTDLKIINIGRFVDQKDQITLLKALNLIKDKISFHLYLVGRGVEKIELENFIIKNRLQEKVKLINFQSNPYSLLKKSNLFILTSIYEGLPNVLLESQVLKKFIISSNCPTGPREILMDGKAGMLFKPGDFNNLSKLILKFSKKKKFYNKKIVKGYNNLYRFDYNKNLEIYCRIVKQYLI